MQNNSCLKTARKAMILHTLGVQVGKRHVFLNTSCLKRYVKPNSPASDPVPSALKIGPALLPPKGPSTQLQGIYPKAEFKARCFRIIKASSIPASIPLNNT